MQIDEIRELLAQDLKSLDQVINSQLSSNVALINQLGFYIVQSGGKRVRPLLVLLSARALSCNNTHHHTLAATIEFIHTATLLHDDVVDSSDMRRGKPTANHEFGNAASVLTGDFLYSRAFQMMVTVNNMEVMRVLSDATNIIAEGEVMQLINCNDPTISVEDYYRTIYCKTAKLFEAASALGAIVSEQPKDIQKAMANYGAHLGSAFQLIDDALDYHSDSKTLGKNVGDDLAEGKPTLPLLHAIANGNESQKKLISDVIISGGLQHLNEVMQIIESTGSIDYTVKRAKTEADNAIAALSPIPNSTYKDALVALAKYAVQRQF
ncbi:MAG: octaprenyl diphosphate synthase [Pseudomonadota bacterium]